MKVFCLAHVVVDPLPDLAGSVTFETHPYLQTSKTSRLLEAVNVILVSLIGTIQFVGKVRWLHPKRRRQSAVVFDQDRSRIERRVEPLMRINRDRIRKLQPLVAHG